MVIRLVVCLIWGVCFWVPILCLAAAQGQYTIVIKEHLFSPSSLMIPAGQKIKLTVDNQDPTAEEFESFELNREKVVGGGKKITVYLGPLKQGAYKYFGDFHPKTARGIIVAR